jgi:Tol biopolymer transport system component
VTLSKGARIGAYEIVSAIGAGGMGEVYRARDSKLKRDVAVKVLPADVANDGERLARFQREAEVLASLNHPHIAQIHGLEESTPSTGSGQAVLALVLELVEGEDLSQRIARGPIPVAEAVAIARQIADALDAAHERGIIHRDLKPANVKVRDDGTVKVLDFGLAKAFEPAAGSSPDMMHSPTITSPATQLGVILGTAAYMAPEQAKGKPVDKRADIWAFGAVLYEMLTGKRAFEGDDVSTTLAAVIMRDPDWSALPAGTPRSLTTLIRRCLDRDPKLRLRDIGEARIALDTSDGASVEAERPAASVRSPARVLIWIGATLAVAAATGLIAWRLAAPADPPLRRFTIPTPGDAPALGAAISPNADAIGLIADDRVWLQRLDAFTATEVPSSVGAHAVFWSPDGAFLGFQARGQLWKAPAAGGPPIAIGRVPQEFTNAGGATWLEDGRIVFTTGGTGLLEIASEGGNAKALLETDPAKDQDFHNPSALPGGRGILFVAHPTGNLEDFRLELYIASDRTRRMLYQGRGVARPAYSPTGHVLFESRGGVWKLPFSLSSLAVAGEPILVADDARDPSIGRDGSLVMLPGNSGSADARLTWVDRGGKTGPTVGQPNAPVSHARISPDGRLVAATVGISPESAIWIFDTSRGTDRRLTFESGQNALPSWTPDGHHVVYHCGTKVCSRRADGSGSRVELLDDTVPVSPPVVSPDGRLLVFARDAGQPDLFVVDVGPEWPTGPIRATPRPLIAAQRMQRNPQISPDGRFVAYTSNEAGTFSAYVSRFPSGEGKWEVSRGFAAWPRWGARGDRIFFIDELRRIVEIEVDLATTFQPGPVVSRIPALAIRGLGFDVAADDQRFLVPRSVGDQGRPASLLLVQHWKGR